MNAGSNPPLWDPNGRTYGGPLSQTLPHNTLYQFARAAHDRTLTPRVLNHFSLFYNRFCYPYNIWNFTTDGAKELGIQTLSTPGYSEIECSSGPFVTLNYFMPQVATIPEEACAGNLTGYSFASYLLGIVHNGPIQPA